jgi:hypothetical protein
MTILFKGASQPQHPVTPDGRYFVVRGKLCRMGLVHALQYGQ